MTWVAIAALAVLALLLVRRLRFSFAAQRIDDWTRTGPAFDIREVLAGRMISEGVIYGPDGRVASRFVAEMEGTWEGNTGVLTEEFSYADGGTQAREWRISHDGGAGFTAEADDLVGPGRGRQAGGAVRMRYRLRLAEGAGGHVLDVTDWMYLMENGTVMNRSEMRKFGVVVAELVATIRPVA
ncbi:DUF3833 family protein [Rhodobacterales bacterium HKCCE2091]|nr:DUF3833 family protein [Rhodobacterales bacterium HKCCE2091]